LFPLLAMGLPISDTAMAIFRRWVRNLPFSSADRRHIHHLLIGLGLDPRQAALLLYCFSGFLCGVVLLGVALRSEFLALVLGLSGSLAFLLILTSRRDELASLRSDLHERLVRRRQERFAAKITWEAIQRIELCEDATAIRAVLEDTTRTLGCDVLSVSGPRDDPPSLRVEPDRPSSAALTARVSGRTATFRLSSGRDFSLIVSLHQASDTSLPADVAFRFLQRLSLATVERLERLLADEHASEAAGEPGVAPSDLAERPWAAATAIGGGLAVSPPSPSRPSRKWLRAATGREARPASARPSPGDE